MQWHIHHIHLIVEPCAYWLNDDIKHNLINEGNEKSLARAVSKLVKNIPEEEFLTNCYKGWNFV